MGCWSCFFVSSVNSTEPEEHVQEVEILTSPNSKDLPVLEKGLSERSSYCNSIDAFEEIPQKELEPKLEGDSQMSVSFLAADQSSGSQNEPKLNVKTENFVLTKDASSSDAIKSNPDGVGRSLRCLLQSESVDVESSKEVPIEPMQIAHVLNILSMQQSASKETPSGIPTSPFFTERSPRRLDLEDDLESAGVLLDTVLNLGRSGKKQETSNCFHTPSHFSILSPSQSVSSSVVVSPNESGSCHSPMKTPSSLQKPNLLNTEESATLTEQLSCSSDRAVIDAAKGAQLVASLDEGVSTQSKRVAAGARAGKPRLMTAGTRQSPLTVSAKNAPLTPSSRSAQSSGRRQVHTPLSTPSPAMSNGFLMVPSFSSAASRAAVHGTLSRASVSWGSSRGLDMSADFRPKWRP